MPSSSDDAIEIRLSGVFTVVHDGAAIAGVGLGSRKARSLLKLLAVERAHLVPVGRIVAILWRDDPPVRSAENVATLVSRLRREVGSAVIVGGREGYRLGGPPAVRVDLDVAAHWTAESERCLAGGEPGLAMAAAERARNALAADAALEDESDADWAEPARAELVALTSRIRHALAGSALALGTPGEAVSAAQAAVAADPYDETACRFLIRAYHALGEPGRALAVYGALRDLLATELGADPAQETQSLYLAVLREEAAPTSRLAGAGVDRAAESLGLVGRRDELRQLRSAWNAAAAGSSGLLLVVGEAGIGKTRLCDELVRIARSTGGVVLQARCYETERSLFLQPIVDAMAFALRTLPPETVRAAAGEAAAVLAGLIPDSTVVLGATPMAHGVSPDFERRRAFEAITSFTRRLAARTPVLLSLDDLQNAGRSTIELLHYLARRTDGVPLLVVATVRVEQGRDAIESLGGMASRLDLGSLPRDAVAKLAAAAGQADLAGSILLRTRGHALFVVETLRALAAGTTGVPTSLQDAVLSRVHIAGRPVEALLRAGAVLGASFGLETVANLLEEPLASVASRAEDALAARLIVVSGRDYEFCNDVVREVLYATTPEPTRLAYHLRAADLLTDRPEVVAAHASAAEDWPRAARAWLLAGEQALSRYAMRDGEDLLSRALGAADVAGDRDVRSRALVARARARELRGAYDGALADLEEAVQIARAIGDRRLEMVALRALGGDSPIALGRPGVAARSSVEDGLRLAASLGDRAMEADLRGRLAVIASNALHFDDAVEQGRRAVAAARASGEEHALAAALDGQKTSLAYLGEVADLQPVLDELEPLLRRLGDQFRLHWTLFESGFPALAAGDWATARQFFERALEANRYGHIAAFESWHVAYLGWLAGLQGRVEQALELGRRSIALDDETPHAWCSAVTAAIMGTTLLETGAVADAIEVLERGRRFAEQDGSESYLLRCLAPLAEATGSPDVLAEADQILGRIATPPGSAWLTGDGAYLAVARAWLAKREPERARAVLAPMLAAADRVPWVAPLADGCLVDGRAALMLGHPEQAHALLLRAADLAGRFRLPRISLTAQQELSSRQW